MFVAWRDLRFAKGRFALMGTVVVLITLLVGLLSGLTAGLARDNTSAVTSLPATGWPSAGVRGAGGVVHQLLGDGGGLAGVGPPARHHRCAAPGHPYGQRERGDRTAAVSAFGVEPDSGLAPVRVPGAGRAVLSAPAAEDLAAGPGDKVRIAGVEVTVAAVGGEASYSHTPVMWDLARRRAAARPQRCHHPAAGHGRRPDHRRGRGPRGGRQGRGHRDPHPRRLAGRPRLLPGGERLAPADARLPLRHLGGFVVGAFFTVWTIQRSGDIAVLKALGASTPYLLRDALGQAVLLLCAGTALGTALATHRRRRRRRRGPVRTRTGDAARPRRCHSGSRRGRRRPLRPAHHRRRSPRRPREHPMTLSLAEVTLTYPDGESRLTALDDVGLDVAAGSLTAVVGPSGSGKSSLLAVAATLVSPDRGRVIVDGTDTGSLSRAEKAELRRTRIGIVFQQPSLLPSLTSAEQLQRDGPPVGAPAAQARGPGPGAAGRGGPHGPGRPPPAPALRRSAPAGQHRPRPDERTGGPPGGRADQRPRPRAGRGRTRPAGRTDARARYGECWSRTTARTWSGRTRW